LLRGAKLSSPSWPKLLIPQARAMGIWAEAGCPYEAKKVTSIAGISASSSTAIRARRSPDLPARLVIFLTPG
jgi:hypothetical protein